MDFRFTKRFFRRGPMRRFQEHLVPLFAGKPGVRALEIGVFEGASGCWLLEHVLTHPTSRYLGIDPWQPCFKRSENRRLAEIEANARHNIGLFGAKAHLVKGTSQEVVPRLDSAFAYDIMHIDGMHTYEAVLADARNCWPRLKPGGVLIFDDYQLKPLPNDPRDGVKRAAWDFLNTVEGQFAVLWQGWSMAVRRF